MQHPIVNVTLLLYLCGLVFYEAHIKAGWKISEVKVGLDGQPISQ